MRLEAGVTAAVIGAGYLGRRAARLLADRGCSVIATARSEATLEALRRDGFDARRLDLDAPDTFSAVADADAVILCPAPSDPSDDGYRRVYADGVSALCRALAARRSPPRLVYTSSTSVMRERDGGAVDETAELDRERPRPAALAAGEDAVRAAPLSGTVLRLSGIYGPDRNRIAPLTSGTLRAPAPGDVANQIHVDDAARAAVFLLEAGAPGEVYLGVDSAPTPRAEVYAWLASRIGATAPAGRGDDAGRGGRKRCSNARLLSLGFRFVYPTFREGYRDLIDAHLARRPA